MEKIPSFTIDHNRLLRGIYVSRKDIVGNETVTTFDIRMKAPNREPALHPGALHTIEHLAATYLRNDPQWRNHVVYWGPMGCLTGNYLLLKGDWTSDDIVDLMKSTFRFIAEFARQPDDYLGLLTLGLSMGQWLSVPMIVLGAAGFVYFGKKNAVN